jgi:flagellar FliJ protein
VRRTFRLATVERLRSGRLDEAARALAVARQGVGTAITHRDAVADELAGCVAADGSGVSGLEAAGARRVLLREALDAAAADVTAARERAAAALAAWTTARAELRAVETLHERHREAVRVEDFRREQRQLDDLAGTRRRMLGEEVA